MSWTTSGHLTTKRVLERQLEAGFFPHAYLFSGPEGVGKKTLAVEFGHKVLSVVSPFMDSAELADKSAHYTENYTENHPDFSILDYEGEITVEVIQDFMSRLSVKPFVSKWKVAIINNAQNLNTHASNALLKTLEEPSASTILILISSRGTLLPTIRSRCQVFFFRGLSSSELQDFASSNGYSVSHKTQELSFGSPARLRKLVVDKAFEKECWENITALTELKKSSIGARLAGMSKFAEKEMEELSELFKTWTLWEYHLLSTDPSGFQRVSHLSQAVLDATTNKNKKLILQDLFLRI